MTCVINSSLILKGFHVVYHHRSFQTYDIHFKAITEAKCMASLNILLGFRIYDYPTNLSFRLISNSVTRFAKF